MIYTSYYQGTIKGESVSISLYPPRGWNGKHLPLFAPEKELLDWWKTSKQDAQAEQEYAQRFIEALLSKSSFIDLWIKKQSKDSDITLLCYEGSDKFCHRHLIGKLIEERSPHLWGGELSKQKPLILPPHIQKLSEEAGVKCDRVSEDLYQIGKDVFMEYGAIAYLSKVISDRKYPVKAKYEPVSESSWNKWFDGWIAS